MGEGMRGSLVPRIPPTNTLALDNSRTFAGSYLVTTRELASQEDSTQYPVVGAAEAALLGAQ